MARSVRLRGLFGAAEVVARDGLTAPEVSGPCRSHREGDALVVEAEPGPAGGSSGGASSVAASVAAGTGGGVQVTVTVGAQSPVVVAVPPDTDVSADLSAANVTVRDLAGDVRIDAEAGTVRLEGCQGAGHIRVRTGTVEVSLPPTVGMTVRADVGTGTVSLPGARDDDGGQVVFGDGRVPLDVRVEVGSVHVTGP